MKAIIVLILLSMLSSCQKKEVFRFKHDAPGDRPNAFTQEQRLKTMSNLNEDSSIDELAAVVLDEDYYGDPEISKNSEFVNLIGHLNVKLLNEGKANFESVKKYVLKLIDILEEDCLPGECYNVKTLRKEPGTRSVVLMAVENGNYSVKDYYDLLAIAYEMSNRVRNAELEFLYLKRAREFADWQVNAEVANEEIAKTSRVFHNILLNFKGKDPSSEEYKKFINAFNPWSYSKKDSSLFGESTLFVLEQAAEHYLYENEILNSTLAQTVVEIQNRVKPDLGVSSMIKDIESASGSGILANLEINTEFSANEYHYIIDRLFFDHFSVDEASGIWKNTKQDKEQFLRDMIHFIQLQIAYEIVYTNRTLERFFENSTDITSGNELIQRAVNETLNLRTRWDNLVNTRIKRLRTFADRHFKKFEDSIKIKYNENDLDLTLTFETMTENIKYLAVYPNMMMLLYLIIKENFQGRIYHFFGYTDIVPATILSMFLGDVASQTISPWFSFGNNNLPLNKTQILYAFDFVMKTQIIDVFAKNPRVKLSTDKLLTAFTEKYLQKESRGVNKGDTGLKDFQESFRDKKRNTKTTYSHILRLCEEENRISTTSEDPLMGGPVLPAKDRKNLESGFITIAPRKEPSENALASLDSFIFIGKGDEKGKPTSVFNFFYSKSTYNALKRYRESSRFKMTYLKTLMTIAGDAESYESAFDDFNKSIRSILKDVWHHHLPLNGCILPLMRREQNLQFFVYEKMIRYYEEVFKEIDELYRLQELTTLKELNPGDQRLVVEKLKKKYGESKNYGYVSPGELASKVMDLQNGDKYKLDDPTLASEARKVGIRGLIRPGSYKIFKWDALMLSRRFLKSAYPKLLVTPPNWMFFDHTDSSDGVTVTIDQNIIDFEKRKKQFVREAMIAFTQKINWLQEGAKPHFLNNRLYVLAELYKISPFDLEPDACKNGDKKNCLNLTAEELVRETFATLDFLNIDKYETNLFERIGRTAFYNPDFFDHLIRDPATKELQSVFDYIFYIVVSDGEYPKVENKWMEMGKEIYSSESIFTNFFFQPSSNLKSNVRSGYRAGFQRYQSKSEELIKQYKKIRKDTQYNLNPFYLRLDSKIQHSMSGSEFNYISPSMIRNNYRGTINSFHSATEKIFKSVEK